VTDHGIDNKLNALVTKGLSGVPENVQTDMSVYAARGMLVESQGKFYFYLFGISLPLFLQLSWNTFSLGPTWFQGTASEHSVMY